jgi:predicted transcriptional regulator
MDQLRIEVAGMDLVERRAQMLARRASGATLQEIANEFGLSPQRIHQIIKRPYRYPELARASP